MIVTCCIRRRNAAISRDAVRLGGERRNPPPHQQAPSSLNVDDENYHH